MMNSVLLYMGMCVSEMYVSVFGLLVDALIRS